MRYFLISPFADSTKIAWDINLVLNSFSPDQGNTPTETDDKNFDRVVASNETMVYGDMFPCRVNKVLQHRELISLNVHPDILAIYNALELDWHNIGFQAYLKLMNIKHWNINLMDGTSDMPQFKGKKIETMCPLLMLTKGDYLDYQHYLKNYPIMDYTPETDVEIKINGKSRYNIYEVLGYEPLTYEQLRQYQWYEIQNYDDLLKAIQKKEFEWHVDWSKC